MGFGIVEGIAVDTHVNRIAHRLALSPKTHAAEPLKTEQDLLRVLPRELVIHRMTGDGAKRSLIAPMWSADKKRVLNALNRRFLSDDLEQGSALLL